MRVVVSDSEALADARRAELDVSRQEAQRFTDETREILRAGSYLAPSGAVVSLAPLQQRALFLRRSVPAGAALPAPPSAEPGHELEVRIENATTTAAAQALTRAGHRPLALNFANGATPGGGFLDGARAQEETLCRQSGLYPTLVGDPMYALHRARADHESTDAGAVSPEVPFFRSDRWALLESPWCLDVITCAAPVASYVGQPRAGDLLARRIARVLEVARSMGSRSLVLGAWGCGAFQNDPLRTATDFRAALEGPFQGAFDQVVFAIADWSPERRFLGPFRQAFEAAGRPGT
jgi:uncharacterized protein (TIGR02452 family)